MTNKEMIKNLKNYAELAGASYGYFHLINENIDNEKEYNKNLITIILESEFTPTQAKNFFKRYDLLIHQPNTSSGFSATLFQDKSTKNFIFVIRGTDEHFIDFTKANIYLTCYKTPLLQYSDMLLFYLQCSGNIPFYVDMESKSKNKNSLEYSLWQKIYNQSNDTQYKPYINKKLLKDSNKPLLESNFSPPIDSNTKLNIVGHSLGGCLAQLFALSFSTDKYSSIINEVYTFNSPGAKDLKPPYDTLISIPKVTNNTMEKSLLHSLVETLKQEALALHLVIQENNFNQKVKEILNNTSNANTYFGINFYYNRNEQGTLSFNYEKVDKHFLSFYQTLIHNYNNRNTKNYKLNISDRVFHIETRDQTNKKHHAKEFYSNNVVQHLNKDIEGNYFILNLDFGGMDSHRIMTITKVLYFYDYLYQTNEKIVDEQSKDIKLEYELHQNEFLKEHSEIDTQEYREHKKALEYCNRIAHSIHNILDNIEIEKAIRDYTNDDYNKAIPSNWIYAIIDKTLFEATIKTQQNKFKLQGKTIDIPKNLIEAILYLQTNEVYIQILSKDEIIKITQDSPLSQLFAIQESLFFISTDKSANPLIKDMHTANRLIGYRTPRAQIFCEHHKADTLLVNCYKDVTLKHYPKAVNE